MRMPPGYARLDPGRQQAFSNHRGSGAYPDRMLDVRNRLQKGDEPKLPFQETHQRTYPTAVTGPDHSKIRTPVPSQIFHQLADLRDRLTQRLGVLREIRRQSQRSVEVTPGHPRIVKGQVHQRRIPPTTIHLCGDPAVADVMSGHQSVKKDHRWSAESL